MCMYERVFITRQKRNSGVLLANVGVTWNSHRWLWAVASQYVAVHGCLEVIERESKRKQMMVDPNARRIFGSFLVYAVICHRRDIKAKR